MKANASHTVRQATMPTARIEYAPNAVPSVWNVRAAPRPIAPAAPTCCTNTNVLPNVPMAFLQVISNIKLSFQPDLK